MTVDPLTLVRGVHFAATLLAAGTTGFIWLVAEPAASKPGFATLHRQLIVWVWLALGENPGVPSLVGGAVVLAALAGHTLADLRREREIPADPQAGSRNRSSTGT